VDGDVALEVGVRLALPEMDERLPGAEAEAEVGGERDRDVEVEDALGEALVGVGRRDEEDEDERERHEHECGRREPRQRYPVRATHSPKCRRSPQADRGRGPIP
jgi:hypothetical protein